VIDSHCHLAGEKFADDLEAVVGRARAAGLERVLTILEAGDPVEAEQAARLEALWPECRVAIGVHPHSAGNFADGPHRAADYVQQQVAATDSARAVGEIGLDYHYDFAPREIQQEVFRAQVRLARAMAMPVVIHTREADADTLSVLREPDAGELTGVFHCFSGTAALARAALDLGFYLSFSGIVTFNRADELRQIARLTPLDRVLVETDSPFLAPIPHRGKRNEPAFVSHVVDLLAGLHQLPAGDVAARTTANFHRLFAP
jgi:TatD DNase family protein